MSIQRSCVVTGAAGGIGAGITARLRADGWRVVGIDIAPAFGDVDIPVVGDVASRDSHHEAAQAAIGLAPLAGWVNCAGYNILGTVADLADEDLRRGVEVDLFGVFYGCAQAVRRFLDQPEDRRAGAIVNISSIQAGVGLRNFAAYAMCKGGVEALTRQVAAEYVGRGIRCNAIAPGLIAGPMTDDMIARSPEPETLRQFYEALTPIGRYGTPDDVAAAVAYLLDEASSGFVTGQVLAVNGGATVLARGH
ncbi:SDR family oxidoreductase [Streptomyces sp. NPDC001508]|uniref:SDR family NAD(P)-dependent oxidoreductase n=1 Tax=Streptomyces sp. NPDC001508 TaxID=3154656 RepID=UPI003326B43B